MRIGAFEVDESVRDLRDPQVISTLRPWIDAGSVGGLALTSLQERLGAREVGSLARPGEFFDFTRYRPVVRWDGDERLLTVPNTRISSARRGDGPDLLFLDVLEPHSRAEDYVDSLMELLAWAGVKAFCRIGAWYTAVPHTRPPRVTHSVAGKQVDRQTGRESPSTRRYEGPTSILNLMNDRLDALGIGNNSLMLQLPHYAQLEEDYTAAGAMLVAIGEIYDLAPELVERAAGYEARGRLQHDKLDRMVANDPELRAMLAGAEAAYDAEEASAPSDTPRLSPEIERFLGEISGVMDEETDS
ncbi:MAG: PAC2 family protein [Tepidiformaceae bacterium]